MSRRDLYPALAAWRRRDGGKSEPQWTYDELWRAAMAEFEAMQHRDNPSREREYQVEAVLALMFAKSVGDPPGTRYPRVVLDIPTQRRYLQRIHGRGTAA